MERLTISGLRSFRDEVETKRNRVFIQCVELGGVYVEVAKGEFLQAIDACVELLNEPDARVAVFRYTVDEHNDVWTEPRYCVPSIPD